MRLEKARRLQSVFKAKPALDSAVRFVGNSISPDRFLAIRFSDVTCGTFVAVLQTPFTAR